MNDKKLEEQALGKAAEIGIKSQLDEVKDVEVDVNANALDLVQGKVDSVAIHGEGMVMQKDLRVETMDLQTGSVAINPMGIPFGNVELTRPTDASAHVVLLEADINRAFNSDYIQEKMHSLDVHLDGKPTTIDVKRVNFHLPGRDRVSLSSIIHIQETGEDREVKFTARPEISEGGNCVVLKDVEYGDGQDLSPELTNALLERSSELLDLRNFELEGMTLRIQKLDLAEGKLTLQAAAHVEEFPS